MQLSNFSARERRTMQEELSKLAKIATEMAESVTDPKRDVVTVVNSVTLSLTGSSISRAFTGILEEETTVLKGAKDLDNL